MICKASYSNDQANNKVLRDLTCKSSYNYKLLWRTDR